MHILVTGGSGFIGSHTMIELLTAGYEVINIDNLSNAESFINETVDKIAGKNQVFFQEDVTDEEALQVIFSRYTIDAVIHFAAYKSVNESVEKPLEYYTNNIGAILTLLKVMKEYSVKKLVFSSSCTVYGQPEHLPVNEESPVQQATSPYGYTKQMGEQVIRDFAHTWPEFSVILLRYFNPVGAHETGTLGELPRGIPNNLAPYITQTAAGIREKLVIFGNDYNTADGTCVRDFIHVMDLAKAHVAALKKLDTPSGLQVNTYNIGTGEGNTVLELINAFQQVSGTNVTYQVGPRRAGDIEKIWADVSKANKELNWKALYNINDAMYHAWLWEKYYRNIS